jgi:hypothetical protein
MTDALQFDSREDLYEFIKKNPNAYFRILKAKNPQLFNDIKTSYSNTKNIGENFWLYCHGYSTPLTCKCGTKLLFNNVTNGYKSKECNSCYNINRKNNSISETLKREQQNKDKPKCANITCNNKVVTRKDGTWSEYCSTKCKGIFNSIKSREKSKQTMLKNHGVEHALQSDVIYKHMLKSNIQKYGVENVMHYAKTVKTLENTNMSRYGVKNVFLDKSIQERHKQHLKEKYGEHVYNISQIPGVHEKKLRSAYLARDYILPSGKIIRIQGYEDRFLDKALVYYHEDDFIFSKYSFAYEFEGNTHSYHPDVIIKNYVIEVKSDYTFYAEFDKNIAKSYSTLDSGSDFIFYIISGDIENYLCVNRNTIILKDFLSTLDNVQQYSKHDSYIVDYYIPDKNIAIHVRHPEFTNERFVDNDYFVKMNTHFHKIGIQLISVFSHDINDVWLKTLYNKLFKNDNKVYARNTVIKPVNSDVFEFLNKNHIQGFTSTAIKYGLYEGSELVAVMCFNKSRSGIGKDRGDDSYELVRYATSKRVIGGASKLLNYFKKVHKPKLIYSYSDNTISNGNMYATLGFVLERDNKADYKYLSPDSSKIHHRFKFRKGALKEMQYYDENLSERDIMRLNGYRRLYDAGKKTWILVC